MATRRKKPPFTAAQARWITEELEQLVWVIRDAATLQVKEALQDTTAGVVPGIVANLLSGLFVDGYVVMPPWPKEHGNDLALLATAVNRLITQERARQESRREPRTSAMCAVGCSDVIKAADPTDYDDEFRAEVDRDVSAFRKEWNEVDQATREVPVAPPCTAVADIGDLAGHGVRYVACALPGPHGGVHRHLIEIWRPGKALLVQWRAAEPKPTPTVTRGRGISELGDCCEGPRVDGDTIYTHCLNCGKFRTHHRPTK